MIWILTDDEEQGLIAFQAKPEHEIIKKHLEKGYLRNYEFTDDEIGVLLDDGEIMWKSGDFLCLFEVKEQGMEVGRW